MARITWCNRTLDQQISPNVGISKEILRNEEGDTFGQKISISIDGYVIATGDVISGARQNSIYEQINHFLGMSPEGRTDQQGTLEILPVDGGSTASGVLRFENAQLTSVGLPESPEDTAGIQYQQYSFAFESYQPLNSLDIFSGYRIKSSNESWELQKQEDTISYLGDNFEGDAYYTYSLSHTLSAVGIQEYSDGLLSSPAWEQAYLFVESKLQETPSGIYKNSYNQDYGEGVSTFDLSQWNLTGGTSHVADLTNYFAYNRIRTSTLDVVGGSYSTTTTYQLSPSSGTYQINVKYDEGEDGDVTISIDGTVSPFSTTSTSSNVGNKLAISSGIFQKISDNGNWTRFTSLAQKSLQFYKGYGSSCSGSLTLDTNPRAISIGQNRNNGEMTFSLSYKGMSADVNAIKAQIPGAIAASIVVSDDNPKVTGTYAKSFEFQKIAIIEILGKEDGPVFQDMATTKERKRTVQMDVTMKQACRKENSSPAQYCYPIVAARKPVSPDVYSQNFTENWDWMNGKYSISVDWIYT